MKLVVNKCFGGFGLSYEAEDMYAERSGFKLFRYIQTKYKFQDGRDLFERASHETERSLCVFTFKKDQGDSFEDWPKDESYWYSRDIERNDPILVEVVETLGEKASGSCAYLQITEIPDDVKFDIQEYDGQEWVAETHRTW